MLPTKGYFQDIECPYFNSSCGRPYCHFRHKKKVSEALDDASTESEKEETVVPTYKPTPKSELANRSHIPISYVPDLAFRSERKLRPLLKIEKPTYKPTPLSILSSANKRLSVSDENGENIAAIKEIKQNIANVEYDPTTVSVQSSNDINFEDLSSEFDLIDEIINEKPSTSSDNKISTIFSETSSQENELPTSDETKNKKNSKTRQESKIQHKVLDKNADKIEKKLIGKNESSAKNTDKIKIISKNSDSNKEKPDKKSSSEKHSDKSKKSDRSKEVKSQHSKEKNKSESDTRKKDNEKREEKIKISVTKEKEVVKDSKDLNKLKSTNTDKKKNKDKSESSSEKSHKSNRDQHRKEEHKGRTEREKSHSSHKKHKSRERSRSRNRSNSIDSNSSFKKSRGDSSRTRSKSKERRQDDKHRSSKALKSESKMKSNSKHLSNRIKDKVKAPKTVRGNSKGTKKIFKMDDDDDRGDNSFSNIENNDIDLSDVDLEDDEEQTLLECYRIFNEYKPPENHEEDISYEAPDTETSFVDQETSDYNSSSKKRIAHSNIENTMTYSQLHPPTKQKTITTPGQMLTNRYKMSMLAHANKSGELPESDFQQPIPPKRSAPTLLEAARAQKIRRERSVEKRPKPKSTCLVDEILQESAKPISKTIETQSLNQPKPVVMRIAPAQNVSLMTKAKERLSKIKQTPTLKTIAQTQKGAPRVAHVPEVSLSNIPDVLQADRSKLPVNVRTRFLTMLADECVKMYTSKEEAFTRALNEEFACYEKCKVLVSYRNSAMLAVNRLRKEVQERKTMGLGLIGVGEGSGKDPSATFKGKKFYNAITKWLLTEEELDIHGYPRENEKQNGCVIIKNSKRVLPPNLDDNQRFCVRCKKIYQVDDDGWPLFEEECIYHHSKKRTIRGEQIYLCCGSNAETGCATSDTHVSEGFSSAELEGFMTTMDPESDDDPRSYSVYALDCEMCYTTKGLELTRVTIVDTECKTVYESLVKPLNPIIDYNTRFSGITKEQMDRTSTSILQIQANILHLCNSKTILIGHSLESDMKALKICHSTVIDTSVLFPHKMGLPHKRALKALASEYLRKIIQNNISGHDSAEDAVTCMELVKWKLKEEIKSR